MTIEDCLNELKRFKTLGLIDNDTKFTIKTYGDVTNNIYTLELYK